MVTSKLRFEKLKIFFEEFQVSKESFSLPKMTIRSQKRKTVEKLVSAEIVGSSQSIKK